MAWTSLPNSLLYNIPRIMKVRTIISCIDTNVVLNLYPFLAFFPVPTPAIKSSFSRYYHEQLYIMDELSEPEYDVNASLSHFYPSVQFPAEMLNSCMREYVNNVVRIQYLLGDRHVLPTMIWESIQHHPDSHEAVNLLARAYYGRQSNPTFSVLQTTEVQTTINALLASLQHKRAFHFSADDAMAALHVVSLFLFEGGQGLWAEFLAFAPAAVGKLFLDAGTVGARR